MSTTHVQSLPNVRGRMSYTEFGEGKRRREHLENGTDRIAAQMGDAASREDFIVYCEGQKHRHPNAVNEGYDVRISWATDELDPSSCLLYTSRPENKTLGELADIYIENRSNVLSPSTIVGYKKIRNTAFQSIINVRI